jgi:hypothetical protein
LPPPTVALVPCLASGERVMMWITPFAVFGPYNAEPGPSTTSIRSMSSSLAGMKWR